MSKASECGHQVNKASLKWCGRCAIAKGLCMHCGAELQPTKRPPRAKKKK